MNANISKVTSKGQVVIPKQLRQKYAIIPSTAIRWVEKNNGILLIPESSNPIKAARGMLKGTGILKAHLQDKQWEKERENKKFDKPK